MTLQIVLWSNGAEGVGGTTLSCVLATLIAGKYNYKTLLTHTMSKDLSMENYLLKPRERDLVGGTFESNVDDLFRLITNGKLTKDMIRNYCFSLLSHSNLDFLNASKIYELTNVFVQNYMYLLYQANEFYDVVVVDLNIPMDHIMFKKVLKDSDVFVVVGSQNSYQCEKLVQLVNQEKELIKSCQLKSLLVINQFNSLSTISSKKLLAPLKIRKPEVVSYQVELLDACNKHELVDFVLRQLHNKRDTGFSHYIKEVTHLVDEVIKPFMEVKNHG